MMTDNSLKTSGAARKDNTKQVTDYTVFICDYKGSRKISAE